MSAFQLSAFPTTDVPPTAPRRTVRSRTIYACRKYPWGYPPLEMIRSFACKETERIWREEYSRKLPSNVQKLALRKLRMLDAASRLDSLRVPPGNRLESLKGDRVGQQSIRINDQWRICFQWHDGDA